MANNFKIRDLKKSTDLHIKLKGDFDGMSAYQLIRVLKDHSKTCSRIFINTSSLKAVNRHSCRLFFTGQKGSELTTYGNAA